MGEGRKVPPVQTSEREARSSGASWSERGQALQQGGNNEAGVDLLGSDPLRHSGRVGAVHDDLCPSGLRDEQRARHLHVEDRQRGAVALAQLGSEPAGRHEDGARKQDVAVRMEHALRPPGGTAGVGDGGQVRRVSPDPPIRAPVSPEALPPLDFPGTGDNHDRWVHWHGRPCQCTGDVCVRQHQLRTCVIEDVALLGWRQVAVDPQPHGAKPHDRVERHDDVTGVREADRHHVIGPDAQSPDGRGRPFDLLVELFVREPAVDRHQGLACRLLLERPLEHLAGAVGHGVVRHDSCSG